MFIRFSGSSAMFYFSRGSLRMRLRIKRKSTKIKRRGGSQINSTRKVSLCLECLMFVVLHFGRLCLWPPFVNFAAQFCCHSWPSMFHHALAKTKCTCKVATESFDFVSHQVKLFEFPNIFLSGLSKHHIRTKMPDFLLLNIIFPLFPP